MFGTVFFIIIYFFEVFGSSSFFFIIITYIIILYIYIFKFDLVWFGLVFGFIRGFSLAVDRIRWRRHQNQSEVRRTCPRSTQVHVHGKKEFEYVVGSSSSSSSSNSSSGSSSGSDSSSSSSSSSSSRSSSGNGNSSAVVVIVVMVVAVIVVVGFIDSKVDILLFLNYCRISRRIVRWKMSARKEGTRRCSFSRLLFIFRKVL